MVGLANTEPVDKVRMALRDAGLDSQLVVLDEPAETPADLARLTNADIGAIAVARVYAIGTRMALVITAADHAPIKENLGPALSLEGDAREASDAEVRGLTGYTADCLPPAGWRHDIPVVIDRSLKRFEVLHILAGDPQCALTITMDDLKRLTGGIVSWNIARPLEGESQAQPMPRNKSFTGDGPAPGPDGK